jgi:hypothetical protein
MSDPTAAQIGRLPKWAQAERAQLLDRIADLEESYDRVMAGRLGPDGSNTFMPDENREGTLWLPDSRKVSFRVGYGPDDIIRAYTDGQRLTINGNRSVVIVPSAGNHFEVELRTW